jgi:ribonucleoside-diphosphate reductase alpha chain
MTNEKNTGLYETYIAKSRYARYIDSKKRRENWDETVNRYFDFLQNHLNEKYNYTITEEMRTELQSAVTNFEVMPSMRSLMTSGKALERDNTAGYNCSYLPIDDPKAFDEAMFILLCGTGVGFSVERQYIAKLPEVPDRIYDSESVIVVSDSKEGWAKSLRQVIAMLYSGEAPKWDVSKVRPSGARLKTFGGRASGPEPLVELFKFVIRIFKNAQGRKLNSIECHDIMCKVGEVVVVGGVRRSAMISLSNLSDDRMRNAKSGAWWETQSHRALANNSAYHTERPDVGIFMQEWLSLYESKSGERGIFNREAAKNVVKMNGRRDPDYDFGTNPCSEIILRPYQFCNLTEIIVRASDTVEDLLRKARIATILGTFQSTMTHFPYLRKIWRDNTEQERLLGVSMTGILDNHLLNDPYDKELPARLEELKALTVEINAELASVLGIPASTAITAIKPSGCTTVDTKIRTTDGIMSMSDIFELAGHNLQEYADKSETWLDAKNLPQVYDENNNLQDITKLYVNGIKPLIEIEFDDGKKYRFTYNHKLLTKDGWKRADELSAEDDIISH